MWPFNRRESEPKAQDAPPPSLIERVADVERSMQQLLLEWHDVMDKINRWAARTAARERHALAALAEAAEGNPAAPSAPAAPIELTREEQKANLRRKLRGA